MAAGSVCTVCTLLLKSHFIVAHKLVRRKKAAATEPVADAPMIAPMRVAAPMASDASVMQAAQHTGQHTGSTATGIQQQAQRRSRAYTLRRHR